MLNSCGPALSQGMEVTSTQDITGRHLPQVTVPGEKLAPWYGATPAQTYFSSPIKLEE